MYSINLYSILVMDILNVVNSLYIFNHVYDN